MSMCDYIFCDIGGMGIETKTLWILSKHFTTEYNSFNIFFCFVFKTESMSPGFPGIHFDEEAGSKLDSSLPLLPKRWG